MWGKSNIITIMLISLCFPKVIWAEIGEVDITSYSKMQKQEGTKPSFHKVKENVNDQVVAEAIPAFDKITKTVTLLPTPQSAVEEVEPAAKVIAENIEPTNEQQGKSPITQGVIASTKKVSEQVKNAVTQSKQVATHSKKLIAKAKNIFVKEKAKTTSGEKSQKDYNQAIEEIKRNNRPAAIAKLIIVLQEKQDFHLARLQLIDLYRKNGNQAKVEVLLNEGLSIDKGNSYYIKQKAALLIDKDQYQAATSLLLTMPAEKNNDNEYQELMAFSYYNQGMYTMAKSLYLGLLNTGQQQGSWWLGLGLCHDALNERDRAIAVFDKLRQTVYLEPEVDQYVRQRLEQMAQKKKG